MHRAIFNGGPFDGHTQQPQSYYESALIKSGTHSARYDLICISKDPKGKQTGFYCFTPPNPKKHSVPADTILNMPQENIHHTAEIRRENQTLVDVLTTLGVPFETKDIESIKNAVIIDQGKGGQLL